LNSLGVVASSYSAEILIGILAEMATNSHKEIKTLLVNIKESKNKFFCLKPFFVVLPIWFKRQI
jgi:hypothetical protein